MERDSGDEHEVEHGSDEKQGNGAYGGSACKDVMAYYFKMLRQDRGRFQSRNLQML